MFTEVIAYGIGILSIAVLLFGVSFVLWKTLVKKEEVELPGYKSPWTGKKGC